MRIKAAFTQHTRDTKRGAVWHASWYDHDGVRNIKSTNQPINPALKDRDRTLAKRAAVQFVGTAPRRVPTLE